MNELFTNAMTWVATDVPPAINAVLYAIIFLACIYIAWRRPARALDRTAVINMAVWSLIVSGNYAYIQAGALPTLWQSGFFRSSLFGLGVSVLLTIIGAYLWGTTQQSLSRWHQAYSGWLQRHSRSTET